MIHSICVFGGVFPVTRPLLEFSVEADFLTPQRIPFLFVARSDLNLGPISDNCTSLARTSLLSSRLPPIYRLPALVCLQYGLRPCHRFFAHHGSCVLCTCSPAGFCCGVLLTGFGSIAMRAAHLDLGDATSEMRPRRCDLVCTSAPPRHSACILLSHADDASPEDLCPPRRPVPCSGTTAPRSRSEFRCNLANEIQSRLATSHRSAGGRRAHLPY